MAVTSIPGSPFVCIGPTLLVHRLTTLWAVTTVTLDAAEEACIFLGQVYTSDGASHTIDTTGSSSLKWRTGTVTFANAGTTVKVGLAAVDAANGPPGRAANATNVISFDVNASFTGGGGGITSAAFQTSVPTAGTKTIANGDLVAFAVQMTARGGADSVVVSAASGQNEALLPAVTSYIGASYAAVQAIPNCLITFSDGATGYFFGGDVYSTPATRTWNSGSATKEYGQLYDLPFPYTVYGIFGIADPDANFDVVLYSDPLGVSPVAERTVSVDANTMSLASARRLNVLFSAPYSVAANQKIGAVFKPGASNISAYLKTLDNAAHRIVDPWGTSGYGISRASGAFADANSSLDHYSIGLIVGAFDNGAGGGGGGGARGSLIQSRLLG